MCCPVSCLCQISREIGTCHLLAISIVVYLALSIVLATVKPFNFFPVNVTIFHINSLLCLLFLAEHWLLESPYFIFSFTLKNEGHVNIDGFTHSIW